MYFFGLLPSSDSDILQPFCSVAFPIFIKWSWRMALRRISSFRRPQSDYSEEDDLLSSLHPLLRWKASLFAEPSYSATNNTCSSLVPAGIRTRVFCSEYRVLSTVLYSTAKVYDRWSYGESHFVLSVASVRFLGFLFSPSLCCMNNRS